MPHITSFADVYKLLGSAPSGIKNHTHSLDHMFELLEQLGNPQKHFKVVHVAGTSGKTSTAYYTAALLRQAGHKVGLTVSPHVDQINERLQINLTPLPEAEYVKRFGEFWDIVASTDIQASYFELCIAFAFWEFAAQKVDYAVVEVGIGGLMDSTNVFDQPNKICVITDIGYDHTHVLGNTLTEIAGQKAGIIQLYNAVFCYQQDPEVMKVIRDRSSQKQGDLHVLSPSDSANTPAFLPLFQKRNFTLALSATQFALKRDKSPALSTEQIEHAAHTFIPARMEQISYQGKTIILDTAHNAQKIEALAASVKQAYGAQPIAGLLSFPADRLDRLEQALSAILPVLQHVIVTTFEAQPDGSHQSVTIEELLTASQRCGAQSIEAIGKPESALETLLKRPEPVLLVAGSTYLLNHIRPLVKS